VSVSKAAWTNETIASGGDPTLLGPFVDSMKILADVLVSNPDENQKIQISDAIRKFFKDGEAFIADQPGLAEIGSDPDIVNDPRFSNFSALYRFLSGQVNNSQASPETAFDFYNSVSDAWGAFFDQLPKIGVQIAAKKANSL
jgi:hypothetical protein